MQVNLEYKQEKKIIFKLHLHSIWSFRHPAKPLFIGFSAIFQCPFAHPLCIFLANSLVKTSLSGPSGILHYFYFFLSAFFSRRCIQHQVLFRHTFDKILLQLFSQSGWKQLIYCIFSGCGFL